MDEWKHLWVTMICVVPYYYEIHAAKWRPKLWLSFFAACLHLYKGAGVMQKPYGTNYQVWNNIMDMEVAPFGATWIAKRHQCNIQVINKNHQNHQVLCKDLHNSSVRRRKSHMVTFIFLPHKSLETVFSMFYDWPCCQLLETQWGILQFWNNIYHKIRAFLKWNFYFSHNGHCKLLTVMLRNHEVLFIYKFLTCTLAIELMVVTCFNNHLFLTVQLCP